MILVWKQHELSETGFASCEHCGRKMWGGYRWACHLCGATYCYVHIGRHAKHVTSPMAMPA